MDWRLGRKDSFRYVRVDKTTRAEKEILTTVSGCKISRNANTELKESGTLNLTNATDIGHDLVRVYLVATQDAETLDVPLATMYPLSSGSTQTASDNSEDMSLMSALMPLNTVCKQAYRIAASDVYVTKAAEIIAALGLLYVATESTAAATKPVAWKAGTKWISIVNDLLSYASFWSVYPDVWGRVMLTRYVAPNNRAPVWAFADDAKCAFLSDVKKTTNAATVPNVCVVTYSQSNVEPVTGSYTNDGTEYPFIDSPFSTVAVGYEIPLVVTIDEIPAGTALEQQAYVDAKAKERLIDATTVSESYTVQHPYAPLMPNDNASHKWSTKDIDYIGSVQSMDLECIPGVPTTSELKRVLR